jgi:hypothetical protein
MRVVILDPLMLVAPFLTRHAADSDEPLRMFAFQFVELVRIQSREVLADNDRDRRLTAVAFAARTVRRRETIRLAPVGRVSRLDPLEPVSALSALLADRMDELRLAQIRARWDELAESPLDQERVGDHDLMPVRLTGVQARNPEVQPVAVTFRAKDFHPIASQ